MSVNSTMLMQQIRISPQTGFIFSLMEIRSFKGNNINRNQMNPYRFEHKSSDMDFLLERVAGGYDINFICEQKRKTE